MARKIKGFPGGARVEALIINNGKILTIHRKNHGQEYWVLPGGGWEKNETKEEGVSREVWEETNLRVEIVRPIFSLYVENDGQKLVYLCKYLAGNPKLGDFNEKRTMTLDSNQLYEPVWININDLQDIKLYTLEFRDWFLENYKNDNYRKAFFEMKIAKNQLRE